MQLPCRGDHPAQPRQGLDPYLLTKPTGCQLQIGARQGRLPSASAETELHAAAAADLQHPLREFREKTLESPLDCKEIQPVHPKGDQSWVFTGRTDAETETPILWPPDVKS